MFHTSKTVASLLAGILVAAPWSTLSAADQPATPAAATHRRKPHKKKAQLVLPPLPSGPLKQVPMDQIPATPAHVSYQSGLLTIAAQNSTLGEILGDVRNLTGASIDIPPAAVNDRVVTHVGPGAPRDVLAQLLNGTNFNYVMLGSASDPAAVATLVLTSKPSGGGEVQTAAIYQPPAESTPPQRMLAPQAFRQQMVNPLGQPAPGAAAAAAAAAGAADADDNSDDADADDKDDDSDQAQPAQPGQVQPDGSAAPNQADQTAPDPNQPNAGPRTPEQMLEMMRKGQPMVPPPSPPPQQ